MSPPSASSVPSILEKIIATKLQELLKLEQETPLEDIKAQALSLAKATQTSDNQAEPRRGFARALRQSDPQLGIIAEIKKASPSKGIINPDFNDDKDATKFSKQYEQAGATCLSVLTDADYFQGHDDYLVAAREACDLPALRKDFMIAPYQIYQSYILGADCILLIMACLDDDIAIELHRIACDLGMDVLIEIHTEEELYRALKLPNFDVLNSSTNGESGQHKGLNIYGINNRDLNTFTTDLNTSLRLATLLKQELDKADDITPLIVTESGIHSADDIRLMLDNDISNFLIGEQFMKTDNPGRTLQSLIASVPIAT